jgi:hypothetical protein
LKREKNIKAEVNEDHLYKPIERQAPNFRSFTVPASLQRSLPYNNQPKNASKDPKQKCRGYSPAAQGEDRENDENVEDKSSRKTSERRT